MNRARIASLALCAYPPQARTVTDDEMLGTLLDATDDQSSAAAFLRELGSVTRRGLVARTRLAVSQPNRRLGTEALSWFAIVVCLWLSHLDWSSPVIDRVTLWIVLLPAVPVIAALGFRRLAGLVGIAILLEHQLVVGGSWKDLYAALALGVGFCGMIAGAAPKRRSLRGRGWQLLAVVFISLVGLWAGTPALDYVVPITVAVAAIPFIPALSLGICGIFFTVGVAELILVPSDTAQIVALLAALPASAIAVRLMRVAAAAH